MALLLDTQAFLWFVTRDASLSPIAQRVLETPDPCFLSIASIWELAIKVSNRKLNVPQPFQQFIEEQLRMNKIDLLPITITDTAEMMKLPFHHRDPFDRIIVAQALNRTMTLVSSDQQLDAYGMERVW